MGITAAIIGIGAASVGASVISSNKASSSAKKAAEEGNQKQLELEKKLYDRQAGVESEANKIGTRDAARKRQLSLAASASGRGDTILTSPLGEVGAVDTGGKKQALGL